MKVSPSAGNPVEPSILVNAEKSMSDQTRVSHPIYNLPPTEIEGFDSLAELALDMHWSWNHATDEVWRQLDPELWDTTHNPWVVLQTVSRDSDCFLARPTAVSITRRYPENVHRETTRRE
jgi:hypothetical protein